MTTSLESFEYNALPVRVLFGLDTLNKLPDEVSRLQGERVLIISTPEQKAQAEQVCNLLGNLVAAVFSGAAMHTPLEVTEDALKLVNDHDIDCLVAIGGGSTTGLSKAIALRTDLPQIAIPTTYAGSEMTSILGQTENGIKTTLRDLRVLPEVAIYDVRLTLTLPAAISGTSGINAIAHAVEALYAKNKNPLTSTMAEMGIASMVSALGVIPDNPQDLAARTKALFGAWLCGSCLANVGMALHHKLCHVIGGSFGLPHAETHTAVLPHAIAYNYSADEEAMRSIELAMKSESAANGLFDLGRQVNATMALRDLGLNESDLDRAADLAVENLYWNPQPIERDGIRELLQNAWAGRPPERRGR
jgi:maleylacetate reductase